MAAQNFANGDWTQLSPVWILIWAPAAKLYLDSAQSQENNAPAQENDAQAQGNDAPSNQVNAAANEAVFE